MRGKETIGRERQGSRGFSLAEVMVALAILAGIITITSRYLSDINAPQQKLRVLSARDALSRDIANHLSNPQTIATTIRQAWMLGSVPLSANNQRLLDCINPTAPCSLSSPPTANLTNPDNALLINVLAPETGPVDAVDSLTVLSGFTGEGRVFHSRDGMRGCNENDTRCPFVINVRFWVTCGVNPANGLAIAACNRPVAYHFRYQVQPRFEFSQDSPHFQENFSSIPTDEDFARDPFAFSITYRASDIDQVLRTDCEDPLEVVVGYNQFDEPDCQCLSGNRDLNGNCTANACAATEIFKGFHLSTAGVQEPVCIPRHYPDAMCWEIDLGVQGDCGVGAFLMTVDYGTCNANWESGKAGTNHWITCENNRGRCCRYLF